MADDIIDQSFPYGESAALAGAKFREVETLDTVTGQVGTPFPITCMAHVGLRLIVRNSFFKRFKRANAARSRA